MQKIKLFSLSWNRFFYQYNKDLKLYLFILLNLFLFRAFLLARFYSGYKQTSDASEIIFAFLIGFQFDSSVAAVLCILTFVVTMTTGFWNTERFAEIFRKGIGFLFVGFNLFFLPSNYFFISKYKENYNQQVFEFIHEDKGAVLATTWKIFPVVETSIIMLLVTAFLSILLLKTLRKPLLPKSFTLQWRPHFLLKVTLSVLAFFFLFAASRGFKPYAPINPRHITGIQNPFLAQLVMNPYKAMEQALQVRKQIMNRPEISNFLGQRSIGDAAKSFFETDQNYTSIDQYLQKTAQGGVAAPPKHIFIFLMESLDSWTMLPKYKNFQLTPNVYQLGQSEKGFLVQAFLPATGSTIDSLTAVVTGLPETGLHTIHQPSSLKPYSTSLTTQFKALGYHTNFFTGGYLGWQRLGVFAKNQGFDSVFGGGSMKAKGKGNEWGVHDEVLFDFIRQTVAKADGPTFNFILTTSNHSPYDIPIYEEGFPYKTIPDDFKEIYDQETPLEVFGHAWYADKQIGRFIRKFSKTEPDSLIAVTGDHRVRAYLNPTVPFYERISVPFLLYGKSVMGVDKTRAIAGGHLDIAPTILELISKKGQVYHSFGKSIFDPKRQQIGYGTNAVITPNAIYNLESYSERLPFATGKEVLNQKELISAYQEQQGLAWWKVIKGDALPPE